MTDKKQGKTPQVQQGESKLTRAMKLVMQGSDRRMMQPVQLSLDSLIHTVREVHYSEPKMIQASFKVNLNDNDMTRRIYFAMFDALEREYAEDVKAATNQAAYLIMGIIELAVKHHADIESALVNRIATMETIVTASNEYLAMQGESVPASENGAELYDPREDPLEQEDGRLIEPLVHHCVHKEGAIAGNRHEEIVTPSNYSDECSVCGNQLATLEDLILHIYSELLDE